MLQCKEKNFMHLYFASFQTCIWFKPCITVSMVIFFLLVEICSLLKASIRRCCFGNAGFLILEDNMGIREGLALRCSDLCLYGFLGMRDAFFK